MSAPVEFKATVAVWLSKHDSPMRMMDAIRKGDMVEAVHPLAFYGTPDRKKFGDWTKVGVAEVTVRLLPEDEQVRIAVSNLRALLAEERAKWLTRQQEILAQINSLQALEMSA